MDRMIYGRPASVHGYARDKGVATLSDPPHLPEEENRFFGHNSAPLPPIWTGPGGNFSCRCPASACWVPGGEIPTNTSQKLQTLDLLDPSLRGGSEGVPTPLLEGTSKQFEVGVVPAAEIENPTWLHEQGEVGIKTPKN